MEIIICVLLIGLLGESQRAIHSTPSGGLPTQSDKLFKGCRRYDEWKFQWHKRIPDGLHMELSPDDIIDHREGQRYEQSEGRARAGRHC
jgi:hypothetical protein